MKLRALYLVWGLVGGALLQGAEYPALVGNGYDALRLEHKQKACLEGKVTEISAIQVMAQFNKVENWSWLLGEMNYSVLGSIYVSPNSEMAKFVFRAKDTHLTATYMLKNHVGVKRQFLSEPAYGDGFDKKPAALFRDECGTQYISVVDRGGVLHVGIKFSFASEDHKEEFEAGGAIKSMASLGAHVTSLNEDISKNSSVEIFFNQLGGDLNTLHSVFDSGDIIACSLDNFKPCEALIQDIWDYSTGSFAKAVLSGKDSSIAFKSEDYPNRERLYESPDVVKERRKLLDSLEQHYYDRDLLNTIMAKASKMKDCDGRCIAALSNRISSNVKTIKDSITLSFADDSRFKHYGKLDLLDLYAYKIPDLAPEELIQLRSRTKVLIVRALALTFSVPLALKAWALCQGLWWPVVVTPAHGTSCVASLEV